MREELKQIENILSLIRQIHDMLRQQSPMDAQLKGDVLDGIRVTNLQFFRCQNIPVAEVDKGEDDNSIFCSQIEKWLSVLEEEIACRKKLVTKTEYDFHNLMQHIKMVSNEWLVEEAVHGLLDIRKKNEKVYQQIIAFHNRFSYFWGEIDIDKGILDLIRDHVFQLKEHFEDFIWLYHELADYRSKKVLYGIIHFWLTFDYDEKSTIKENNFDDYFDYDLFQCDENEVFVDVGAFNGDSALSYIENYGNYKSIYCYEITPDSFQKLEETLSGYENITLRNVGVGDENKTLYMQIAGTDDSCNKLSETGKMPVEIVRLDDDIKEPVTLIKMDIEGSELAALEGARRHIQEEMPKLAICTYHNNHHIWEIPRLIKEMNPQYKLYMRYNGSWNGAAVSEFVTFGL